MKNHLKILICLILTVISFIQINDVIAVGQVYHAIVKEENGKESFIYRTAVKPYWGTTINLAKQYGYDNPFTPKPQGDNVIWAAYKSRNLIFTKNRMATYSPNGNIKYGYAQFNEPTKILDNDMKKWLNNLQISHIVANVKDNYVWDFADKQIMGEYDVNYDVSKSEQERYNDNLYHVGTSKIFQNIAYAYRINTGNPNSERLPIINANFNIQWTIPYGEYRAMLCREEDPLLVFDIRLGYDQDKKVDYALQLKEEASKNNPGDKIYVSAITETLDQFNNRFYMITPESFLHAKGADVEGTYNWAPETLGRSADKLYSGLNLWDNELVLPVKKAEHKIIVRHLGVVGKRDENYLTEIIDVSEALNERSRLSSLYINNTNYWSAANAPLRIDGGFESAPAIGERYRFIGNAANLYKVLSLNIVNPTLDLKTINGTVLKAGKYQYMGYQKISVQSEADFISSDILPSDLKTGAIEWQNPDDTVDNVTIVNLYYSSTADIEVKHRVYKNGNAATYNIEGLKQSSYSTPKIIYPTQVVNFVEYYNATDIKDSIVFDSKKISDLPIPDATEYEYKYIGYEINGNDDNYSITSSEKSATLTNALGDNGKIKLTFKYMLTTKDKQIKDKEIVNPPPNKDIKGKLVVQSISGISKNCDDGIYSIPTNAKTGQNDIYAGISDVPMYVLAGINVDKLEHSGSSVDINIKFSFGPYSKSWSIKVPYYLSYYVVNNLLIYKYNNAEIYNTAIGYDTGGDVLFSASDNIRRITPTPTSTLTLQGVNGNITNNSTSIQNWKNYLRTNYKISYNIPSFVSNSTCEDLYKRNIVIADHLGNSVQNLTYGDVVKRNVNYYMYISALGNAYRQITLDSSVSINLQLASINEYNRVSYSDNSSISSDDLILHKNNTDAKLDEFKAAAVAAATARNNYYSTCRDLGYGYGACLSAVSSHYSTLNSQCTSKIYISGYRNGECLKWSEPEESEDGETESEPECLDYEQIATFAHRICGDEAESICVQCGTYRYYYNTINYLAMLYNGAINSENIARSNLQNTYAREKAAIQNYDELHYIQSTYWNVYKQYSVNDVIELLGLNLKFDYKSTNARLGSYDLMTVQQHTLEKGVNDIKRLNETQEVTVLDASRQTLSDVQKKYYTEGIPVAKIPAGSAGITGSYYKNNQFVIPITRLNGKRMLAAKAIYNIEKTGNIVGTNSGMVKDNLFYEQKADITRTEVINGVVTEVTEKQNTIFQIMPADTINATYGRSKGNTQEFNIYSPLVVETDINQDFDIVNQDINDIYNGVDVVQANSQFTINFKTNYGEVTSKPKAYYINDKQTDFTSRYLNRGKYYIKFEFPINNARFVDSSGYMRNHGSYMADTWIGPIYADSFTAEPTINTVTSGTITDNRYQYYVLAVAINVPPNSNWTERLLQYISTGLGDLNNAELLANITNICGNEGGNKKISYYSSNSGEMVIVNRMYDFRITDLKDVDWKNVFRNNTNIDEVNSHTGIAYYAGISKWNTESPTSYNEIVGRTEVEVGKTPLRILPLGPYKNTDTTYVSAPKMGYRFSFDFKVTGEQNPNKSATITTRFYYISKDGKTYDDTIQLYYKNKDGKYIKLGSSGDDYLVQFTPKDGYRAVIKTDINNLSTKDVTLGTLSKLTLNAKDVTTYSENEGAITYYGEYKLPNSTIAVAQGGDINNPLKNGYIGVVFDIIANETNGTKLQYGVNSYNNQTNSSQWDWEGYLGITKPTKAFSTVLKLENGEWAIDNTMYNKIKGTVILYDTDTKAANDFM